MKPEIYEEWEQALSHLGNAEKLYEDGKFQEAAKEANGAIISGCFAIIQLAEELKLPDLSVIQENVFYEWAERKRKHYTPKENIEWVRSTLKRLSDELPPDTLRPLK
jgi:nucleoid-associated protein YejK